MNQPWQIRLLDASATAQAHLKKYIKGYNFLYCPLEKILKEGRDIFYKYHLIPIQNIIVEDNKNVIVTKLYDCIEKNKIKIIMESKLLVPIIIPSKKEMEYDLKGKSIKDFSKENENQILGASITYIRRYAFFCIMNIYPDSDFSGEWKPKYILNEKEQKPLDKEFPKVDKAEKPKKDEKKIIKKSSYIDSKYSEEEKEALTIYRELEIKCKTEKLMPENINLTDEKLLEHFPLTINRYINRCKIILEGAAKK